MICVPLNGLLGPAYFRSAANACLTRSSLGSLFRHRTHRSSAWVDRRKHGTKTNLSDLIRQPFPQSRFEDTAATSAASPLAIDPDSIKPSSDKKHNPTEQSPRLFTTSIKGVSRQFDALSLRDACPCHQCIDPSTTQKRFDTTDIPLDIQAKHVQIDSDDSITVSWKNDIAGFEDHRSQFSASNLGYRPRPHLMEAKIHAQYHPILWHSVDLTAMMDFGRMTFRYDDYMHHNENFAHAVRRLLQYGMIFISGVPPAADSVATIGSRIGPLMSTIYGASWDVKSQTSAKNVADTSSDLAFHMDLLYYKEPPRLQILHFLKQSLQGGESLFSDSYKAAYNVFNESSPYFSKHAAKQRRSIEALTQMKRPFHYKNNGHWLEHSHTTIAFKRSIANKFAANFLDPGMFARAIEAVRWSPPFQAPPTVQLTDDVIHPIALDDWVRGARRLKTEFEKKEAVFETKMTEGTCVIFDNWRILHARKAFSGGERWLRGAYIDDTTFRQQVLKLDESKA